MADDEENRPRKIKLETRHGSSRQSRSRKDRPCDVCRSRKSACVIAVKPPCRFCELRGLECSFTTVPRPRRRNTVAKPTGDTVGTDTTTTTRGEELQESSAYDKVSPQDSRFPAPPLSLRRRSGNPEWARGSLSPVSTRSQPTNRQYLSLEQLMSPGAETPQEETTKSIVPSSSGKAKTPYDDSRSKYSLEHGKNLTAHFIGLAGEQDTDLFSSIRYNVLNETRFVDFNVRQVYAGDTMQGSPPIHFSILHDIFPDRDNLVKKSASDAIESLVGANGDALFRLYFRFVHPVFPILSKAGVVKSYATNKLSIPSSLRGCIYALACSFWTQDPLLPNITLPSTLESELFEHVHASLNRELDSPKLSTLQACLLVLHQQPDPSGTTESPRVWVLACQATACAQSLGLHMNPTLWKLPSQEKRVRRKLWWATFLTDRWSSICHGNTPHIVHGSYDTKPLEIEDLVGEEDVVGLPGEMLLCESDRSPKGENSLRFLEVIKVTLVFDSVLSEAYTLSSYRDTIQKVDTPARDAALWSYKIQLDQSLLLLPTPLSPVGQFLSMTPAANLNSPMHLSFFAAKFLTMRALMAPATPESKSNRNSKLCQHFNTALSEGEAFVTFARRITGERLYTFWFRHSRTNLIISSNFLIYLFFLGSTEEQVAQAYDMLQRYHEILMGLVKVSDWSTIGLIRPSLLRIESFFNGAAEGIKGAGRVQ